MGEPSSFVTVWAKCSLGSFDIRCRRLAAIIMKKNKIKINMEKDLEGTL